MSMPHSPGFFDRQRLLKRALAVVLCFGLLPSACPDSPDGGIPFGEPCDTNNQCATGFCMHWVAERAGFCSSSCTLSGGCPHGFTCTPVTSSQWTCLPTCRANQFRPGDGFACASGRTMRCELVSMHEYCAECGCPDGYFCDTQEPSTCRPLVRVGNSCSSDAQCVSGNCGTVDGHQVCLVPIGSHCTDQNCEVCLGDGAFCSEQCSVSCLGNNLVCGAWSSDSRYACVPYCASANGSCPGTMECVLAFGGSEAYICLDPSWR